ncbi:MAG: hypothetical protein QMD36_03385 [Candidatus Aenigmarchaeota archaeon]|nr:hypothetical protein [Candidatus Aenigmarchaeota archaeon]
MTELIPLWFYAVTSIFYTCSAIICFLVSYFGFKAHRITSEKSHLFLFLGFLTLGLGFLVLSVPSLFTYATLELYHGSSISINLINYYGFRLYYIVSLFAYFMLFLSYLPKKLRSKFFILFVPIWYASSFEFHVLSVALISFIVFRCAANLKEKKNLNSGLVTYAFTSILVFHLLLLLTPFSGSVYFVANIFLITGFVSLLYMLIRVVCK